MAKGTKVYTPGGAGGKQGVKAPSGDPLDVSNSGTGRKDFDRIGGSNSRAQTTSKNSKGQTFRGK